MPKPYSVDLRARVIEDVETGASRREAAERYGISPSVVVKLPRAIHFRSSEASPRVAVFGIIGAHEASRRALPVLTALLHWCFTPRSGTSSLEADNEIRGQLRRDKGCQPFEKLCANKGLEPRHDDSWPVGSGNFHRGLLRASLVDYLVRE